MKRITVEEVRAAYEKTGLEPCRRRFGDGKLCGCPLTAVLKTRRVNLSARFLCESDNYAYGFIRSIDGRIRDTGLIKVENKLAYKRGYADGLAVRQAIFGEETA
jgi:hypothetical protein